MAFKERYIQLHHYFFPLPQNLERFGIEITNINKKQNISYKSMNEVDINKRVKLIIGHRNFRYFSFWPFEIFPYLRFNCFAKN